MVIVVCSHGSLATKCEVCERDATIEELRDLLARWLRENGNPCGPSTVLVAATVEALRP